MKLRREKRDIIDVRDSVQCGHYATVKGLSSEVDMIRGISMNVEWNEYTVAKRS